MCTRIDLCDCYGGGSYQGEVDRHKSEEGVHTNLIKGGHQNQIVECYKENFNQKHRTFEEKLHCTNITRFSSTWERM